MHHLIFSLFQESSVIILRYRSSKEPPSTCFCSSLSSSGLHFISMLDCNNFLTCFTLPCCLIEQRKYFFPDHFHFFKQKNLNVRLQGCLKFISATLIYLGWKLLGSSDFILCDGSDNEDK